MGPRELREIEDPDEVGGKAAGLAALLRAEIPIPPTWVLPAGALDAHLRRAGATELAREVDAVSDGHHRSRAAATLRAAIFDAALDDGLAAEVSGVLAAAASLAIRSSATTEGLPGSSLAGRFQSFLDARSAAQASSAVRSCWASLWSPGALRSRDAAAAPPRMAVVLQWFVAADAAGTAEVGPDGVVVESAWGLGPAVLSGLVVPDRWSFDRDGRPRSFEAGRKPVRVAARDGATSVEPVRESRRGMPSLDPSTAGKVASCALRAAAALGEPLLIEWTLAKGELRCVQATPRRTSATVRDAVRGGLRGIAAAPGIAVGRVVIARGERIGSDPAAVLVARYVPAPAVMSLRAAAIVTEMGGSSAHLVSLARERGLPMVTAVAGASRSLHDGDLVRVDGTRGRVERITDNGRRDR